MKSMKTFNAKISLSPEDVASLLAAFFNVEEENVTLRVKEEVKEHSLVAMTEHRIECVITKPVEISEKIIGPYYPPGVREIPTIVLPLDGPPEGIMGQRETDPELNRNPSDEQEIIDRHLEDLWAELDDVPFDESEDGRLFLVNDWHQFKAGTEREEIWRWFDKKYSKGLHSLIKASASL